jgi:hypothetical protein
MCVYWVGGLCHLLWLSLSLLLPLLLLCCLVLLVLMP